MTSVYTQTYLFIHSFTWTFELGFPLFNWPSQKSIRFHPLNHRNDNVPQIYITLGDPYCNCQNLLTINQTEFQILLDSTGFLEHIEPWRLYNLFIDPSLLIHWLILPIQKTGGKYGNGKKWRGEKAQANFPNT